LHTDFFSGGPTVKKSLDVCLDELHSNKYDVKCLLNRRSTIEQFETLRTGINCLKWRF